MIYLPYHLSREATELGIIEVMWVRTIHNIADLMTKGVNTGTIESHTAKLNVHRACGRADASLTV